MRTAHRNGRVWYAVVILALLLGLGGCSGDEQAPGDPILGLWEVERVESDGLSIPVEEFSEMVGQEFRVTFAFAADGTVIGENFGNAVEGSYTVGIDTVTVGFGSGELVMAYGGGEMRFDQSGLTVVLRRSAS